MNERKAWLINGYIGLLIVLLLFVLGIVSVAYEQFAGAGFIILGVIAATGLLVVQPNQATALVLFGQYRGSVREPGLWMTVPFTARKKVSLRVRNFNSKQLKVNDVDGNPIEIAAVIVFKVTDSFKSLFDVDNYMQFVENQSETALRHVASIHPYDNYDSNGLSLRGNSEEVADELKRDLQWRLKVAGVEVLEARLTHLAYSAEIAHAMLQRQQATAILAARQKIVEGAVGMVQMAIDKLESEGVVELDEERKAQMINNLMVAIVSERSAQPVVNASTLY